MGLFKNRIKARDHPKVEDKTAGSSYTFYMGGSSAGKNVNERSAMQMTAVYACVRILSEAVAGLPLHLYRYKEDGGKEKAIDHSLFINVCKNIRERQVSLVADISAIVFRFPLRALPK